MFTPRFFRNFSVTVDYYRIKVKNAIGIIGQQTSLDECYTGSGAAIFCNNVIRGGTGRITTVNALNLNTGSFLVSGIDAQAQLRVPLGSTANLNVIGFYNHRLKQEQTSFPGGPTQDEIGQLDCYNCGRLGTGFKTSSPPRRRSTWAPSRSTGGQTISDRWWTISARARSAWVPSGTMTRSCASRWTPQARFGFYLGIDNVFDKKPPVFGDTNLVTFPGAQTSANTYDLYGRMLYAGVDFKF